MLVVDIDALLVVDPLDFADQIQLGGGVAPESHQFRRIERTVFQLGAHLDLVTVLDQ